MPGGGAARRLLRKGVHRGLPHSMERFLLCVIIGRMSNEIERFSTIILRAAEQGRRAG